MDLAVAASLGVLFSIFAVSAVAVVLACRRRLCRKQDLLSQEVAIYNDDRGLVRDAGDQDILDGDQMLDDMARDEAWVRDAMDLTPHCLAVMRTCHSVADRLLAAAVAHAPKAQDGEAIAGVARQLSEHVEGVAGAMYPPLDPRLVEARCTALMLCMTHLVFMVKKACPLPPAMLQAVGRELREVEDHLLVLRQATCQRGPHAGQPAAAIQSVRAATSRSTVQVDASLGIAAGRSCWTTSSSVETPEHAHSLPRF